MIFFNDSLLILFEFYLIFCSIFFLLIGTHFINKTKLILVTGLGWLFIYILLLSLFLIINSELTQYCLFNFQYLIDDFALLFRQIFLIFLIFSLTVSFNYFFIEKLFFIEYYFLIGFLALSAFFLMSANDFCMFYFSLELQALVLYTLATLKRYNSFSTESGLKYFVLGALSSGFLVFGISLIYGFLGITCFWDFKFIFLKWAGILSWHVSYTALLFICVALLFKLALAPFHVWMPEIYEGSATPIVLIFSIFPKIAIFIFCIKFFFFFFMKWVVYGI